MLLKSSILLSGLFVLAVVGSHAELPAQDASGTAAAESSQQNSAQPEVNTSVFRLKHMNAHEAVEVLTQTISLRGSRMAVDSRSNSLVFVGTKEEADRVADLLETLDQPSDDVGDIKVFPIQNGDCREAIAMLETLFDIGRRGAAGGVVRLSFAADVRTNSILARGDADDLAMVEALLSRIDLENASGDQVVEGAEQAEMKVFYLKYIVAEEAADFLNRMLGGGALGRRAGNLSIVADAEQNSLFVTSPAGQGEALEWVEAVLAQLDVEGRGGNKSLKTFPVKGVDASEALAVLGTLLHDTPGIRMTSSPENNAIIFYGTSEDHELVASILSSLDTPAGGSQQPMSVGETNSPGSYKVRLIWLSDDGETNSALPEDLQSVAEELSAYGFDHLEVAGQLMVNTTGNIDCTGQISRSNGGKFEFHGSGLLAEVGDKLKLSLNIRLQQQRTEGEGGWANGRSGNVAQTSTEIFTQPGNLTVLGVSPAQSSTAIFVVQVLEN